MTQDNILKKDIGDLVRSSMIEYGEEVNKERSIPYYMDGLKPAHKRVILTGLKFQNKTKTIVLAASTVQNYSPHGDAALVPVISKLVQWGIFTGQGAIGQLRPLIGTQEDAAPRYTSAYLSETWRQLISRVIYLVPKKLNSLGVEEPEYIPCPLPISLIYGRIGLGVGCRVKLPAFTAKSLLHAYLNDDPNLLESNYGYHISKEKRDELWNANSFNMTLSLPYTEDSDSITVTGDPELVRINKKAFSYLNSGKMKFTDLSDKDGNRLQFNREFNVRNFSIEDMKEVVRSSIHSTEEYNLLAYSNRGVYKMCLKKWIGITYSNYLNLLKQDIEHKKNLLTRKLSIEKHFKNVAKELLSNSNLTNLEVSKKLGVDLEIVDAIGNRTISALKNHTDSKAKLIKKEIKELSSFNSEQHIINVVEEM